MTVKQSRFTDSEILDVLGSLELLSGLDSAALQDLVSESERVHFVRGDVLMKPGEQADCMYVVISGRLHIALQTPDEPERVVREVGPGESLGEMALISGEPRSATVRAARDAELLKVSKSGFDRLIHGYPEVLMRITRTVVHRLRTATPGWPVPAVVRTIGVLPAGANAPLKRFSALLVDALNDAGSVLHLDSRRFDGHLGEGAAKDDIDIWDETDSTIAAWLTEQEATHRFVVYEADHENSAWTRRCIRQADRVILVGNADSSPALSAPESVLFEVFSETVATQLELVLLHEKPGQLPAGTRRWLERRSAARLHHMHMEMRAHFERLVRFLTGRAVGLVLGGGGARGAAHIGAIQALLEAGIPIDMIGGTSAGGMVSALYAMGYGCEAMRDAYRQQLVESRMFQKYTLPIVSLIAGSPPDVAAQEVYAETQIEDLLINFFCVSCNLSTGGTIVHQRGSLWRAVRATTSLPGILVPVVEGQHLLIDGGVVDNLPATIMKELNSGPLIVVNVSPDSDVMLDEDLEGFPSPAEILWSWVNPFKRASRVPTIMTIMVRVAVVNSLFRKEVAMQQADFLVDVPVHAYGLLDFEALDEMVDVGYRHAREKIGSWAESGLLAEKLGVHA
jgi:predicted acylesterase/phospholipase RssA